MSQQQIKYCPHCSQPLALYMTHCGRCGKSQMPATRRVWIPVVICAAIFLLIVAFSFFPKLIPSVSNSKNIYELVTISARETNYPYDKQYGFSTQNQEYFHVYMTYPNGTTEDRTMCFDHALNRAYMYLASDISAFPRRCSAPSPQAAAEKYMNGEMPAPPPSEPGYPAR